VTKVWQNKCGCCLDYNQKKLVKRLWHLFGLVKATAPYKYETTSSTKNGRENSDQINLSSVNEQTKKKLQHISL